jgi:hypothetical protein
MRSLQAVRHGWHKLRGAALQVAEMSIMGVVAGDVAPLETAPPRPPSCEPIGCLADGSLGDRPWAALTFGSGLPF